MLLSPDEVRNLGSQDLGPHGDRTGVVIEDTIVNSRSTQCMECEDGYQRNKSEGNPHICYGECECVYVHGMCLRARCSIHAYFLLFVCTCCMLVCWWLSSFTKHN